MAKKVDFGAGCSKMGQVENVIIIFVIIIFVVTYYLCYHYIYYHFNIIDLTIFIIIIITYYKVISGRWRTFADCCDGGQKGFSKSST